MGFWLMEWKKLHRLPSKFSLMNSLPHLNSLGCMLVLRERHASVSAGFVDLVWQLFECVVSWLMAVASKPQ